MAETKIKFERQQPPGSDLEARDWIFVEGDPTRVNQLINETTDEWLKPKIVQRIENFCFGVHPVEDLEELEKHRKHVIPILKSSFEKAPKVAAARLLFALGDDTIFDWAVEQYRNGSPLESNINFLPLVFLLAGREKILATERLADQIVASIAKDQWPTFECAVKLDLPGGSDAYLDFLESLTSEDLEYQGHSAADLPQSTRMMDLLEQLLTPHDASSRFENALVTQFLGDNIEIHNRAKALYEKNILGEGYYSGSYARTYFQHCKSDSLPFLNHCLSDHSIKHIPGAIACLTRLSGKNKPIERLCELSQDTRYTEDAVEELTRLCEGSESSILHDFFLSRFKREKEKSHKLKLAIAILRNGFEPTPEIVADWYQKIDRKEYYPEQLMEIGWEFNGITPNHAIEFFESINYTQSTQPPKREVRTKWDLHFYSIIDLFESYRLGTIIEVDGGGCDINDIGWSLLQIRDTTNGQFDIKAYRCQADESEKDSIHEMVVGSRIYRFSVENSHSWFDPYLLVDILNLILANENASIRINAMPSDMFQYAYLVIAQPDHLQQFQSQLLIPFRNPPSQ